MAGLWRDCDEAPRDTLDTSPSKAKLFLIGLSLWLGLMILKTWFVWAGVLATLLTIYGLLLATEYVLRAWFWLCDHIPPRESVTPRSAETRSAPKLPGTPCADAQGRIEKDDLGGHDVSAMAETILRHAAVRKTCGHWPTCLGFPGICRAIPSLGRAGKPS